MCDAHGYRFPAPTSTAAAYFVFASVLFSRDVVILLCTYPCVYIHVEGRGCPKKRLHFCTLHTPLQISQLRLHLIEAQK